MLDPIASPVQPASPSLPIGPRTLLILLFTGMMSWQEPCTAAAKVQRVTSYPVSFEIPDSWNPIPEPQRKALHAETQSQYAEMYQDIYGQDLHYFDRMPYLGAYESPDGSQHLIYSVLRFPPTQDYFSDIQRDIQEKAEWGKERGYIESMTIQPVRQVGQFRCFEFHTITPDGEHHFIGALFDSEKPYQVIQIQLFAGASAHTQTVFTHALETLTADFTYPVKLRNMEITISEAAQRFVIVADVLNENSARFLLVFQDPHWDHVGHEYLLSGLIQILNDNEALLGSSVILTEGFPGGSVVDTWPLFIEDPICDESLVRPTLESYLIPGHVALGWCTGSLIPILGAEDWVEYKNSAELWVQEKLAKWRLSVVARNSAIAHATLDAAQTYENPMLVVGGMHLLGIDEGAFRQGALEDPKRAAELRNRGVADYFADAGWGVVYLEPVPNAEAFEDKDSFNRYRSVFQLHSGEQYKQYRKGLLKIYTAAPDLSGGVTVSPNPQQASILIRELKQRGGNKPGKPPASSRGSGIKGELRGLTDRLVGTLRAALRGTGNFSLGKATRKIADLLGRAWVGPGAKLSSDRSTWISLDKLRQYRVPSYKKSGQREGAWVANFERRDKPEGEFPHNGHLAITDP